MDYLRRPLERLTRCDTRRKTARARLKAAKNADHEQYLALVDDYIDLAQTYLHGSAIESSEQRIATMTRLFTGIWQNLPYAERLSDVEYMLSQALIASAPAASSASSPDALLGKLRQLPPQARFALLAYHSLNWPIHWLTLALRIKAPALHLLLCHARCEICAVSWDSLAVEEQDCLVAISATLEQSPNLQTNQTLHQKSQAYPRIMRIKAQWLELRPELVELRLRNSLSPSARQHLLANLRRSTRAHAMQQPALVDRIINSVQFSRHDAIQVG